MVHSQCLKPINKILWVVKSGVETIDAEQICIERVGEKAFGLASLPAKWTLPFFVISDELFDDYTKAGTANDLMTAWGYAISLAAAQCKIELDDQIIVRSNAHSEGLEDRGKFISVEGSLCEWPQLVKRCFDDFIAQEGSSNVRMPVIRGLQIDIDRQKFKYLHKSTILCNDNSSDDILDGQPCLNAVAVCTAIVSGLHPAAKN